ncbi:hypothetical protein STEG23_031076, partial [Scotinomys teguina]
AMNVFFVTGIIKNVYQCKRKKLVDTGILLDPKGSFRDGDFEDPKLISVSSLTDYGAPNCLCLPPQQVLAGG